MQGGMFFQLGKFIYRFRWPIVLLWLILILGCLPFLSNIITPFKTTGFTDKNSASAKTEAYLNKKIGYQKNRFIILYKSKHPLTTESYKQIKHSLENLDDFPIKHEIIYPDDNKKQISKDKHAAYVVVLFKGPRPIDRYLLMDFKSSVKAPPNMTVLFGGEPFFVEAVNKQTQKDLYNADLIAAPVSIITLILVFGSVVAAMIPIILGGGCALLVLCSLYFLAHAFPLSIFTLNIALLLGLCLSLDYSLFIISRYREELRNKESPSNAIAITLATAGKAVFFSGLAVFISLSALLFFPINILFSVGTGGLVAVFISVLIAVCLLPAVLAILHTRVDLLSLNLFKNGSTQKTSIWKWIATKVVKRPFLFFIVILVTLLLLGYPFLHAKFGISDFRILPENSESRLFFDTYTKQFNENELTPISMVLTAKQGNILSKENLSSVYNFANKLERNPLVHEVNSIVTTKEDLDKSQYYTLYHLPKGSMKAGVKTLLATTTNKQVTVINVVSKYPVNSPETKKLLAELQAMYPGKNLTLQITGVPANNQAVLDTIARVFPFALLWIIGLTYLILLFLLRSLFLPFKAIIMNILSLSASYGVLVFIFQEGHLHQLLNFDPQGMLDVSLLIIIFCALFGFSMDYEVFLLSRIKECYVKTKNNERSIIFGIAQSSRIITSAALIVIFICCSFMVADVLMVKAFGLGIAVAIFVDAFLIRSILVPSTMALVKKLNWYLPKWLDKLLPK